MKLTTRIRVRTMMAIVALVALGFGVTFELNNHARRDYLLKRQASVYREAATHLKRALECQSGESRKVPYRAAERRKLLSSDGCPSCGIPSGGFPSWQAEFQHHVYWGWRLYDTPQGFLEDQLHALDTKLLLP